MFCVRAAKAQQVEEAHLRAQLAESMEALQSDPANVEIQNRLSLIGEQLGAVEKHHVEGLKVWNRVRRKKVGDVCSKEFFQTHKDWGAGSQSLKMKKASSSLTL